MVKLAVAVSRFPFSLPLPNILHPFSVQSFSDKSGRPLHTLARHELLDDSLTAGLAPSLEEPPGDPSGTMKSGEKARGEEAALKREQALAALKAGVATKLRVSRSRRRLRLPRSFSNPFLVVYCKFVWPVPLTSERRQTERLPSTESRNVFASEAMVPSALFFRRIIERTFWAGAADQKANSSLRRDSVHQASGAFLPSDTGSLLVFDSLPSAFVGSSARTRSSSS